MTSMLKVKVRWSGFTGSPGWSNFFFATGGDEFHNDAAADAVSDKVDTFIVAVKGLLPVAVNLTTQTEVEEIQSETGELSRVWSGGPRASVAGSAAANGYSAASGTVITWRTNGVRNGRRVRGRTFLVPCATVAYDLDGSLQNSTLTTLQTAAAGLITPINALQLGVWSRPSAPGATDGVWHPVSQASVPDKAAVLRSRRD